MPFTAHGRPLRRPRHPAPGSTGPQLRQYTDGIEAVRILYFLTALHSVVVIACIDVQATSRWSRASRWRSRKPPENL